MNGLVRLICPDCGKEMSLPEDMVAGKEIRCYGCGKRMPFTEYINPQARLQAEKKAEAELYKERARQALKEEGERKAAAVIRRADADRKRKEAEAKAEAERQRKEAEAKAEAERKRREAEAERQRKEAEARAKAEAERQRKEAEAKAEAERKRREAEARLKAWKAEGRYAKPGSLRLQNGEIKHIKPGHNTVGRGVDADIQIERDNIRLSRVHLFITANGSDAQGYVHEAALAKKEVNETRLNDIRMVFGQTYTLKDGDKISLPSGQIEIKFIIP